MKTKIFLTLAVGILFTNIHLQAMTRNSSYGENPRVLIAYFSATGTTARIARQLADITGGTLYAIRPERPYTDDDLDWRNPRSRSSVEMNDPESRPAIREKMADIDAYDVIYVGYPVWWDLAPRIVNTFIESHDLRGKTVIPFATSGSSPIRNSAAVLRSTYPELRWQEGRLLNRPDERELREWVVGR